MPSIITIIPARGGSKGIPKKNIALLNGKPLLVYTIEAALSAGIGGPIIVSTDNNEIADVVRAHGAEIVMRPAEISGDTASTESALLHVLDVFKERGLTFDMVLTLQPTSPFRAAETIKRFVERFIKIRNEFDAMLSLNEDRTDFWVQNENDQFRRLFPDAPRRRQARKPLYAENSALYITNSDALRKTNFILGTKPTGFIIDADEALDINEPRDMIFAEFLMQNRRT